ncbi:hypothetical protein KUC_0955 [Vreelandella boliviensis LC1]|uniref:Uncharacterized protein n=1 Tax=Vreelandella boliviensis LC1 TaxID=1072583 RepID=A0A7U9C6F5_9GAMM|nr:hypothetical protein KUC_0955 [Halomonas boliviensis LC1]
MTLGVGGYVFLSCLGGSARWHPQQASNQAFLSCLGGSALSSSRATKSLWFLSCLGGTHGLPSPFYLPRHF